jgi:hypothetical protein
MAAEAATTDFAPSKGRCQQNVDQHPKPGAIGGWGGDHVSALNRTVGTGRNGSPSLAMQKVVGSSPIIGLEKGLETGPFCCQRRASRGRIATETAAETRREDQRTAAPTPAAGSSNSSSLTTTRACPAWHSSSRTARYTAGCSASRRRCHIVDWTRAANQQGRNDARTRQHDHRLARPGRCGH